MQGLILHRENILKPDYHAQQRTVQADTPRDFRIKPVRLRPGIGRVMADEGVDLPVHLRQAVKAGLQDRPCADFALHNARGQFRKRELIKHVHARGGGSFDDFGHGEQSRHRPRRVVECRLVRQ